MSSAGRVGRARRRCALVAAAGLLATGLATAHAAGAGALAPEPTGEVMLAPVLEEVLAGDLVMAANSNLLSAGGWRRAGTAADVDGDATRLCIGRRAVAAACADNSSSALLDIPAGARVVQARLYVETSLSPSVGALRVRLDGPDEGFTYTELGNETAGVPKLAEATAGAGTSGPVMRQAIWDVTDYVAAAGPGAYTVADIVHERAGAFLPYASWAIVAAYELDPDAGIDVATLAPEQQQRFARRLVSWHDGLASGITAPLAIPVSGYTIDPAVAVFAKSFHIVAHAQHRGLENLLFDGLPIGNNALPGDPAPPPGVAIGTDPACNAIIDVVNDTICHLGAAVTTRVPGADAFVASRDGRTPSSGSGVDIDVVRIPAQSFVAGATTSLLNLHVTGGDPVAVGMLAVSVDLPPPAEVTP